MLKLAFCLLLFNSPAIAGKYYPFTFEARLPAIEYIEPISTPIEDISIKLSDIIAEEHANTISDFLYIDEDIIGIVFFEWKL